MPYQIPLDNELIVDNFAGGGGASTGIELALGRPVNIAINHDARALGMHEANHPQTRHICENVFAVDPVKECAGRPVLLAWFSPDCTHHSKAKGGKPRKKHIRGLAWVVIRWARTVRPRIIMLENVEEFQDWGPLTKEGSPCPERKGQTFNFWVESLKRLGYKVEWKQLRACDYGVPTIRKRLFLVARCDGMPIVWPEPTHGKAGSGLLPYRTAAECIDWSIPCPSIFERKRPLAENTLRRIAKGIKKFVIDSPDPFIIKTTHKYEYFRGQGTDEPLQTVTGVNPYALISPTIVPVGYGERPGQEPRCNSVEEPLGTVVGTQKHALVIPTLVGVGGRAGQSRPRGCDEPIATITAKADVAVAAVHISRQFGQSIGHDMNEPTGTATTKEKSAIVTAFLAQHNTERKGVKAGRPVDAPMATITASGNQIQVVAGTIMKMRGDHCIGHDPREPLHTISAQGTHHAAVKAFLIKYFGTDQDPRLDEPLHTITTKDRFGLITIHGEDWQIVDIGMRMLTPRELYLAQGFPPDYIIDRTASGEPIPKSGQVRHCGNSVPPGLAKAVIKSNTPVSYLFEQRA